MPLQPSKKQRMTMTESKEDEERKSIVELIRSKTPTIEALPDVTSFSSLTQLNLPGCGLSTLPSCLPQVVPNLSILFMPNNNIVELPAVIGACPKLQMISFKNNGMTFIHPDALQPQLRWLILTGNAIATIPDTIGRCKLLQKCMLSGNKLTDLPSSMAELGNLELIRLACNNLKEPPLQLLGLQNLRWVAVSNNPFITNFTEPSSSAAASLPVIDDPSLDANNWPVLGQGAGGVTRKARYDSRDVAVKTYIGELTSDGSPLDEKKISMTAFEVSQHHPSLIQLLGETKKGALVMEFLDGYSALAGPPSFQSCSRDVYDPSFKLTTAQACHMLHGLAEVMAKLHENGICHGDFYAHNILIRVNDTIDVKLSDFGAAFFYDRSNAYSALVEACEVRAFGTLMEEVVAAVTSSGTILEAIKAMIPCGETRPVTFSELCKQFKQLPMSQRDE